MTKQTVGMELREKFVPSLNSAFLAKYGREIETEWNIFHERYVSRPADGQDFLPEQISFISGYEEAWLTATAIMAAHK